MISTAYTEHRSFLFLFVRLILRSHMLGYVDAFAYNTPAGKCSPVSKLQPCVWDHLATAPVRAIASFNLKLDKREVVRSFIWSYMAPGWGRAGQWMQSCTRESYD